MIFKPTFVTWIELPPKALKSHVGGSRMAQIGATKKYRAHAQAQAKAALEGCEPPKWRAAFARADFWFRDKRRRDMHNLHAQLKSVWDGIVDAGVLEDDDLLVVLPPRQGKDPEGVGVCIEIMPATESQVAPWIVAQSRRI